MHQPIGRLPAHATLAEQQQKDPFEFFTKYHIDDKINATVERDQQIGDHHFLGGNVIREGLIDINVQCQSVKQEKNEHHTQQHRGQTDLTFLGSAEQLTFAVRFAYLCPYQQIEYQQAVEWNEIVHHHVAPVDVDFNVFGIATHFGGHHAVNDAVDIMHAGVHLRFQ